MAGGTWTTQNKDRPGVYINYVSAPSALGAVSDRGVVSLALSLPWGVPKQLMTLEAGEDITQLIGFSLSDPAALLIREALKRARTLLLYRLNTGTAATATAGELIITANHGGTRGNDLTIVVQENVDDETLYEVSTLLDGVEVDKQTVTTIEGLVANAYVSFNQSGELTATAGAPLTGGSDGTVQNQDHIDYMAAIELHDVNTIAYTGSDPVLKGIYTSFIRRLREDEGKKIQAVMENYPLADYEGIISVKNGVVLSDGTTLTAAQATAWVAGATAAAPMNQALTYQSYDDAVDVIPRYTNSQIIESLRNGELVFTPMNGRAVVEQDINTLTSFTPERSKAFSKNRVMRVLDGIANDMLRIFSDYYLGKVNNDADGRSLLRNEMVTYLSALQGMGAIQEFDSQSDIFLTMGSASDSVYVELAVQPTDAIEKIYMKVTVR